MTPWGGWKGLRKPTRPRWATATTPPRTAPPSTTPDGRMVGYAYDPANRLQARYGMGRRKIATYSHQGQRLVGGRDHTQRAGDGLRLRRRGAADRDHAAADGESGVSLAVSVRLRPGGQPHGGDRDAAAAGCDAGGDGGRFQLRRRRAVDGGAVHGRPAFAYGYDAVGNRLAATGRSPARRRTATRMTMPTGW